MKDVEKCKVHSKYRGKREPLTMCQACWQYYVSEQVARIHEECQREEYTRLRQAFLK